jgi:hypothetical protein
MGGDSKKIILAAAAAAALIAINKINNKKRDVLKEKIIIENWIKKKNDSGNNIILEDDGTITMETEEEDGNKIIYYPVYVYEATEYNNEKVLTQIPEEHSFCKKMIVFTKKEIKDLKKGIKTQKDVLGKNNVFFLLDGKRLKSTEHESEHESTLVINWTNKDGAIWFASKKTGQLIKIPKE